ncbi:two-component regulator propeller domain-containing protein [Hymenobacter sp. M29]|uniref:histidine kinase n=1 Tax=Hymenobacter mellowenesis TaxID=3063995 RepID=A0ABT9AKR0_9BACT|nr:two-component regulator propeller domain-containing protein [Hymenobacter sp. M29]MDO7849890.1 two-component regulator propeller domain-containing protein [Hymenobacter sp. M29]
MVSPLLAKRRTLLYWLGLVSSLALRLVPATAQTLAVRAYTTANGLVQSSVYCLGQDVQGRLWVGTQGGVCVFDGKEFRNYGGHDGLPDSHVQAVALDPDGQTVWLGQKYAGLAALGPSGRIRPVALPGLRGAGRIAGLWAGPNDLWVGSKAQGVWRLRFGAGRRDTVVQHWSTAYGLPADTVEWIGPGLRNRLWAATPRGLLLFDRRTGQPLPAEREALPAALQRRVHGCYQVNDSVAWVAAADGLLRVSSTPRGWRLRRFAQPNGLPPGEVLRVVQDGLGRVWASTVAGLCRGLPQPGGLRFQLIARRSTFDNDRGCDVLVDREGSLWAATDEGVNQYLTDERFAQYTTADGLPSNVVTALAQARPDELWVGTQHDIGRLPLTATGPQPPARKLLVPARTGRGHYVLSLLPDHRGGLWVGTLGEGARRYDLQTGHWETYDANVEGLAGQYVASMAEDRRGRVWLVTHRRGVTVYDPSNQTFRTFRSGQRGLPSDNFWQVYPDRAGRLWLASDDAGLVSVDTDHDTFRRVDGQEGRLSIGSISEDRRGHLWLGPVGQPLMRYEPATGRLHTYGLGLGLQSINPYFVLCDSADQVWVGTHLGIDVLDTHKKTVRSYAPADGFLGGETDENAVLLSPGGQIWMGTVGGLMGYDPHHVRRAGVPPLINLTNLRVNLRDTALRAGLTLPYHLNGLSFDFRGVSLARPGSVRYQYRLRGLGDAWTSPGEGTAATFANLPPGPYTFEVRASSGEGGWSAPAAFGFSIEAPWWRRWWAWCLYASALVLALYGVRRRTRQQERERADRDLERQALGHLQEMDRVKTDFFTNISHELRTPLTLILGPAELLAQEAPDPTSRQRGSLVLGQARKLLSLINQLLDLSKLDAGALRLHPTAGDVGQLVRHLLAGFEDLAARRGIALRLEAPIGFVPLVFDAEKLDEVLTNLLANALRFTPAGGQVTLRLVDGPPTAAAPAGVVELAVQDTGPGIASEHLLHLFDRFYQAGAPEQAVASEERQGTGIGLALVRELVALHGGTVEVSSQPNQGACFVVRLPRGVLAAGAAAPPAPLPAPAVETAFPPALELPDGRWAAPLPASNPAPEAALVLIIEDSDEVRAFIAETLAPMGYRLLLAADGAAGLELARAEVPDLVVSDVMMPGLSGYQVCAALKNDPATSHIPVVLLTARSSADDRLEGLETGANAYLPKPFRPRELQAQLRSLLSLSQQNRARFAALASADNAPAPAPAGKLMAPLPNQLAVHAAAVAALPSLDQAFLEKFDAVVLAHLGDESYGVDQLGQELGLSRTQLHRKLKALTGQAPGEYLRNTRLLRALALLQAKVGTVAEVAYQVGYGSPAHFSTAFSRQFGYAPSTVGKE